MRYTEAVALLRRIPVFASLDPAGLKMLAFSSTFLMLDEGEVLCHRGEPGDSVFVIDAGEVEVSIDRNGTTIPLAVLGRHDLFGEMAVICNLPRTADVRARGPLTVLKIEGDVFLQLVTGNPDAALGVMRVLTHRLMRFNEAYEQLRRLVPESAATKEPIQPA